MGLMRALQGVATGYLSGEVDRMAAIKKHKLEMQKKRDAIKAQEASSIAIQDAELDKRATIRAEEEETDKKDRMQRLLAMGYTEEYVRTQMPSALLDDNLLVQLDLANQGRWGDNKNWKTIKLTHGPKWAIGMTPMEYELELFKKSKNKNNIKSTIKDTNNISDNVSNVVFEETDTLSQVKTEEEPYNWSTSELLNGKKTALTRRVGNFINSEGHEVTALETETSPGSGVFGDAYVTMEWNGEPTDVAIAELEKGGFVPRYSEIGENYYFNNNEEVKTVDTNLSFMITKDGKSYGVYGYRENYEGNQPSKVIITNFEPALAKKYNITNDMRMRIEEPFGQGDERMGTMVPFNTTLKALRDEGFIVNEYDKEAIISSRTPEAGKEFTSLLDVNRMQKAAIETVFGTGSTAFQQTGLDPITQQPIYSISITGEDPSRNLAATAVANVTKDLETKVRVLGKQNKEIPNYMVEALDLLSPTPNMIDTNDVSLKVGLAFRKMRNDLKRDYLAALEEGQDLSVHKQAAGIGANITDNSTIAEGLANFDISNVTSIEQLVLGLENMKKTQVTKLQVQEENTQNVIQNYFPSPTEDFSDFIAENITAEDIKNYKIGTEGQSQLVSKLSELIIPLTGGDKQDSAILLNEARNIITRIKDGEGPISLENLELRDKNIADARRIEGVKFSDIGIATVDGKEIPFPPSRITQKQDPQNIRKEEYDKWSTKYKEDWNAIIDYINKQKPEIEQKEMISTHLGKEKIRMVDTEEFKQWKNLYKRYLDIGKL